MPRIRADSIAAHKELTRRQILEAAAELFVEHGYEDTGLADIAAQIGIGRTTLYEYFTDKEEILVCLVEDTLPTFVDEMIGRIPAGLSHRERLSELIIAVLEFVSDPQNLGVLVMREVPKLSAGAQERVLGAHRRFETEMVEVCRAGVADDEFRAIDPDWAGRMVNAITMCAARALLRDEDPKQRLHDVADTLLLVLFQGLAGR